MTPVRGNPGWRALAWTLLLLLQGCHLRYDSDELDLGFYQWNRWVDTDATLTPSCGWEEFHRGVGDLVRIPSEVPAPGEITWFHCRFTLPEEWDGRPVSLELEDAGPDVQVYLNGELLTSFSREQCPHSVDATGRIYYTRDNHLGIRIESGSAGSADRPAGIAGEVTVRAEPGSATGEIP